MKELKLYFQRKLRRLALRFEHKTAQWVIPQSTNLCLLIENTPTPDFQEYNRRLNELRARWKIDDPELESYAVRGRLMQFKFEHKVEQTRNPV